MLAGQRFHCAITSIGPPTERIFYTARGAARQIDSLTDQQTVGTGTTSRLGHNELQVGAQRLEHQPVLRGYNPLTDQDQSRAFGHM